MDMIRQCKKCDGVLPAGRRKFCSDGCSSQWHRSSRIPKFPPAPAQCHCGAFIPARAPGETGPQRKWCSFKCHTSVAMERKRRAAGVRKLPPPGVCQVCGTTENLRRPVMCGPCDNARATRLYRLKVPYVDTSPRVCAYEYCGNKFKPTQQAGAMYCSKLCKTYAWKARNGWAPQPKREPQLPKIKVSDIRSLIFPKVCAKCKRHFIALSNRTRMCSAECKRQHNCDKLMGLYRAARSTLNITSAMHWHRELCRYLATRDGSACGICGDNVQIDIPSGIRGENGGDGPSVDHIVPTSKGGSDDLSNLRLTHWRCNKARGNRDDANQLRLVA